MNAIDILASILIVIALVKIIILVINPNAWGGLLSKIYTIPGVISVVGFLLSVLTLYFILNAGISIIEILAVCLFIALLMLTGLANYSEEFIVWLDRQNIIKMVKRLWLYSSIWLVLIIWGIYALLTK
ncbi:MAG: hypothetical protein AB8C40_06970 [Gammaproteobacteria bacterium]